MPLTGMEFNDTITTSHVHLTYVLVFASASFRVVLYCTLLSLRPSVKIDILVKLVLSLVLQSLVQSATYYYDTSSCSTCSIPHYPGSTRRPNLKLILPVNLALPLVLVLLPSVGHKSHLALYRSHVSPSRWGPFIPVITILGTSYPTWCLWS
jgi:hypothetical protein